MIKKPNCLEAALNKANTEVFVNDFGRGLPWSSKVYNFIMLFEALMSRSNM